MMHELMKQWVEALRSGDYKQVGGVLSLNPAEPGDIPNRDDRLFCCLGVLCDIHPDVTLTWEPAVDEAGLTTDEPFYDSDHRGYITSYQYDDSRSYEVLPTKFREAMGMSERLEKHLAEMNDSGVSFDLIADEIEKRLIPEDSPDPMSLWDTRSK